MKVKSFLLMALMALFVTSCSDDDDAVNYAMEIAGTYAGENAVSVGKVSMDPYTASFKIEGQADGKATVLLPGTVFKMGPNREMKLPDITLKDVEVIFNGDNNGYTLKHAAFVQKVDDTSYTNNIGLTGTIKDNKITVDYDLQPGAMPMAIVFKFVGTK